MWCLEDLEDTGVELTLEAGPWDRIFHTVQPNTGMGPLKLLKVVSAKGLHVPIIWKMLHTTPLSWRVPVQISPLKALTSPAIKKVLWFSFSSTSLHSLTAELCVCVYAHACVTPRNTP